MLQGCASLQESPHEGRERCSLVVTLWRYRIPTDVSSSAPSQHMSPGCGRIHGYGASSEVNEHSYCQNKGPQMKTDTANAVVSPRDMTLSAMPCSESDQYD